MNKEKTWARLFEEYEQARTAATIGTKLQDALMYWRSSPMY